MVFVLKEIKKTRKIQVQHIPQQRAECSCIKHGIDKPVGPMCCIFGMDLHTSQRKS